jgi:hypothetical protein
MDRERAKALERILEALIAAGEAEAFMAVARRIEEHPKRRIRVSIEPPLDDGEPMAFDDATGPTRFIVYVREG